MFSYGPQKQQTTVPTVQFTPNVHLCVMIIFGIGVVSSCALLLAALVAVAYILNLAMTTISELAQSIAALYTGSDSIVKLLILCIAGYCVLQLFRRAYRSFIPQGGAI